MLNKKNIVLVVAVVLIVLGVAFFINKKNKGNDYSVVYLTTGEVYIGKLTTFPDFQLRDGYILVVTKDETDTTKNNFRLNPINQALWAPESIHLVRNNVAFYGKLLKTSKIAETIAAQKKN